MLIEQTMIKYNLLKYWVKGLILYTLLFLLYLLAINEVNENSNPELAKPLWFIIASSSSLGALISLVNCLKNRTNGENMQQ